MKRERINLSPTGLWMVFGPILTCMWLAAVNYSNNLVYAILYLIASVSFISLFHTWRNMASLTVEHIRVKPAFVGKDVEVEIFLQASPRTAVYGLVFTRLDDNGGSTFRSILRSLYRRLPSLFIPSSAALPGNGALMLRGATVQRIAAGDSCSVEVSFPAGRRGVYRFEALQVKSSFPFGLFWAGFRIVVDADYYVYPQARGSEIWPQLQPAGENGSPHSRQPGDDFAGVRAYSPGESLRHIDWKAYARGRPLSIKQFTGGDGQQLWLDASKLNQLTIEDRLSQLALWVVNAEKMEIPYTLRLGRVALPLGLGPAQSRLALQALAVAGLGASEKLRV